MKAARTNKANLLNSSVVAVVVAVGVAVAVGVLCQQPGAQAQDATVGPSYTVKDLGTLGGPSSSALGINDAGQVVGFASTSEGVAHAFLYERSATPQMQDLGTLGGNYSSAWDINDAEQVVGNSDTSIFPYNHAFLYERSATPQMQDLGTLGGNTAGAHDINDAGQVVGVSTTSSGSFHAFLHERSATPKMQDLNSLIPPHSGWSLEEARAINQRGQIVGLGERNGHNHAFLLTPRKKTL
jgi:probable HAF family extracellular repeat protein